VRRTALGSVLVLVLGSGLSGIETAGAQETTPRAIPPPMPVPEMPVPEESRPAGPPPGATLEAAPPVEPAPLAPPLTTGFPGLGDNICTLTTGCIIPPDTHGAAGPNHLMEVLNTEVQVQDRGGAVLPGWPVTLNDFWAPVNPPIPPASAPAGAFDPRVHYDPEADRWISVACDENYTLHPDESAVMVGVSVTGDPTGPWYRFRFDVDPTNQVWADYPNVGFNGKWVVVQVNLFTVLTPTFASSQIWVFDKTQLYAGNFTPAGDFRVVGHSGTQVPATTYDTAEPNLYLLQRWNGAFGRLRLYRITGPANAPVLEWLDPDPHWVDSPVPWSGSATGNPPIDFAPQIEPPAAVDGCTNCSPGNCLIQANDDRIQNLVLRNGTLWTTQTVFFPDGGSPSRSSVQWWQIDPNTTNVLQRGLVDDPTGSRFFAFPSIAVNKHEDVLLGYSSFEDTQYASGSYSFRTFFDLPDTMQPESPLHAGDACYFKDLNAVPSRNRWGDYSATVVDPDETKLWTLQEYAAFSDPGALVAEYRDKWGTWWGMLDTTRTISISDVSLPEGDSGTTPFTFTLALSAPTPLPVAVSWSTSDGTATTLDGDYVGAAGAVTFAPGETTQTLTVDVSGDMKFEADETFVVNLSFPTNAELADNQATGTILNDDLPPRMSIGDVQALEGDSGTTDFTFQVTLSQPSGLAASAAVLTVDGTATVADADYNTYVGPPVSFPPGVTLQAVTVTVNGDTNLEPDEVFYADLTGPVGATLLKARGVGVIQDDDTPLVGVEAFTAVAGPTGGQLLLQWLNPAGAVGADEVVIRYNQGNGCSFPTGAADGLGVAPAISPVDVGNTQSTPHTGLVDDQEYCYRAFIRYGGSYSGGEDLRATPFDAGSGKLRWKYFTGATVLAAPTVSTPMVMGFSNDNYVHALQRGPSGGPWPGHPWRPWSLGSPAQQRSPVVPLPSGPLAYVTTQDGRVHAISVDAGVPLWETQLLQMDDVTPATAEGAPAGIFTVFKGAWDYILVGTNESDDNRLYALDPLTGAVLGRFDDGGGIGAILGMPTVDYAASRVYFASMRGSNNATLWCLDLGPPGPGALTLRWKTDAGHIAGSAVLRRDRVYAVDTSGNAWSVSTAESGTFPNTPEDMHSFNLGDVNPKGFLFPDRRNDDLYVATENKVHGLVDAGGAVWSRKWPELDLGSSHPSIALFWPGTNILYVGVDQYPNVGNPSRVLQIDTVSGNVVNDVILESSPQAVGAPSLDTVNNMLHVGSEPGVLYGLGLPF
jgi:hypothetical protein